MTNKNFATDIAAAAAPNYKPVFLTGRPLPKTLPTPITQPVNPATKEAPVTNQTGTSIELIDLSLLNVDLSYQRTQKPHAKKIARDENFDANAVGYPVVNRRPDKSLWIIDGQQRVKALRLRGIEHWSCRVLNLKTVEEEADLFGVLNGSEGTTVAVSQTDKFRGLIAAKNEHALACIKAVAKGGMMLVPKRYPTMSTETDAWKHIDSTSFVMAFAKIHGYDAVTNACRIISQSWPQSWEARKFLVVGAVFRIVGEFPDLDHERCIQKFRTTTALTVEQEAKKAKSLKSTGGLGFLLTLYNKGLRTTRLSTTVGTRTHPGRDGVSVLSDTAIRNQDRVIEPLNNNANGAD